MIDDSDQQVLGVRWVEEGLEKGLGFCVGGGWAGERARGRRFFFCWCLGVGCAWVLPCRHHVPVRVVARLRCLGLGELNEAARGIDSVAAPDPRPLWLPGPGGYILWYLMGIPDPRLLRSLGPGSREIWFPRFRWRGGSGPAPFVMAGTWLPNVVGWCRFARVLLWEGRLEGNGVVARSGGEGVVGLLDCASDPRPLCRLGPGWFRDGAN